MGGTKYLDSRNITMFSYESLFVLGTVAMLAHGRGNRIGVSWRSRDLGLKRKRKGCRAHIYPDAGDNGILPQQAEAFIIF